MYSHVQLTQDGTFLRRIEAGVPIEWDAHNFCTAFALVSDGKAEEFRVHSYFTAPEPVHNRLTHKAVEVEPAVVEGNWTQQWQIVELAPEDAAHNMEAARAATWERIKAERDRRCILGVKAGGHWFHSDSNKSRIQQLGLTVYIPPNTYWKTLTFTGAAVFVPMTPALAMAIVEATAQSDVAIHTAAEAHNAAMRQSATPDTYDFSGGWPLSIEDEAHDAGLQFDSARAA